MSNRITNTRTLQVQQDPKEGILLWMQSATSRKDKESQILSGNIKITQVTQETQPAYDSEKQEACATSLHNHTPHDQQWGQAPKASYVPTCDKACDKLGD